MPSGTLRQKRTSQDQERDSRLEFRIQRQRIVSASVSSQTEYEVLYDAQQAGEWSSLLRKTNIWDTIQGDITVVWDSYFEPAQGLAEIQYLHQVKSGNTRVVFDKGVCLQVEITWQDDRFSVADNKFGIYGFGASEEEARHDYEAFFVKFFTDIVNTPESQLAPSTLEYKQTLQAFGTLITDE